MSATKRSVPAARAITLLLTSVAGPHLAGIGCGEQSEAGSSSNGGAAGEASIGDASDAGLDGSSTTSTSGSLFFIGGDRVPLPNRRPSSQVFVSRVTPSGSLEPFGAGPAPPFRGTFAASRNRSVLWLVGSGQEDTSVGGSPTALALIRGALDANGTPTSWRVNVLQPPSNVTSGALVPLGPKLIYVGGEIGGDGGASGQVYAAPIGLVTGTVAAWEPVSGVSLRGSHVLPNVVAGGGYLYVVGGRSAEGDGDVTSNEVEVAKIDEATGAIGPFSTTTPLARGGQPFSKTLAAMLVHDGTLYLAGGVDAICSDGNKAKCRERSRVVLTATIDPTTGGLGEWREATSLPAGLAACTLYAEDKRIFVIGGSPSMGNNTDAILANTIEAGGSLGVEWVPSGQPKLPTTLSSVLVVRR